MEAYYILNALFIAAIVQGSPVPDNDTVTLEGHKEENLSGFFIPVDTWNSFQNQLQPKTNQPNPSVNNQEQNVIKFPNPADNPTETIVNVQVNGNEKNPTNAANPIILTPQPDSINQQMVLQPGQFVVNQDSKTGQMVLIPSGTVQTDQLQSNKPIILVTQPQQNPTVVPQQPNQPLNLQQGQILVIQNGQEMKPTQVSVAIPSNNQGGYTNTKPNQNQNTVYTLVLNSQNPNPSQHGNLYPNQNGNIYLVPVQSGSSNPIILTPAK